MCNITYKTILNHDITRNVLWIVLSYHNILYLFFVVSMENVLDLSLGWLVCTSILIFALFIISFVFMASDIYKCYKMLSFVIHIISFSILIIGSYAEGSKGKFYSLIVDIRETVIFFNYLRWSRLQSLLRRLFV